jgi:hypothetical protein
MKSGNSVLISGNSVLIVKNATNLSKNFYYYIISKKSRPHLDVERGWSGANEHFPQQNSNILHTIRSNHLQINSIIYINKQERNIMFKNKTVFKIRLP